MNKYVYRLIIGVFVYFFFRLNLETYYVDFFAWNRESTFYLIYTVIVIQIIWEVLARAIRYWQSRSALITNRELYFLSLKATMLVLPMVFLFSYIFNYHLKVECNCDKDLETSSQFWMTSAQGFVIGLLVQAHEIIRLYIRKAVQNAREKELIQKELISAKFEGLKKQVNPHFLFNSFSVLSSLVSTNGQLAQEFIDKLSDMYRYILENEERELVSLKDEIGFLDDYIFLMKIRHPEGLVLSKKLDIDFEKTEVPPMSLQILVENAIKHNSFSAENPLEVNIQNEGTEFLVVENQKSQKKEIVSSTGIGLKNLSKRLMLSMRSGLQILDQPDRFQVKIPIGPTA